jgi:Flp pilus assembly protein TadG
MRAWINITAPRGRGRLRRLLIRFADGRGGASAVEFAIIALPFLMLVFGIMEISMIYLVSTTLDNATVDVARQIRTGAFQNGATANQTEAYFQSEICNELSWLGSNCSSNLYIDVRTFSSFNTMTQPSPIQSGKVTQANLQFSPGNAGDIVMVRAFYQWTLIAPALDGMVATMNGGSTLLTATSTFKNEPYSTSS